MADLFPDYSTFTEDLLRLPINGKEYVIPEIGAADKITLNLAAEGNQDALAKLNQGDTLLRMLLGSALDEMLADNVPAGAIDRAEMAALADQRQSDDPSEPGGRLAALYIWTTGKTPEARAAIVAAIQAILATP